MRVVLILAAAALPGLARADDDPACARFEEPLAYNACLASHGPKANDMAPHAGVSAGPRSDPEGGGRSAAPARPWAHSRTARHQGRVHMEFRVR